MSTSTKSLDVVVCGSLGADIIGNPIGLKKGVQPGSATLVEKIRFFTGGFGCNVAMDIARLGCKTGVVGVCGDDSWKDMIFSALQRTGADASEIAVAPRCDSPATMVCVDPGGERTFFHAMGTERRLDAEYLLSRLKYIGRAKVFALGYYGTMPSLEPRLPEVLKKIKASAGIQVLLDTDGAVGPTLPDLARSLPHVDFFIPSYDEAKILTDEKDPKAMVRAFRKAGASGMVGVKLGSKGCHLSRDGEEVTIPAFPVNQVVDTTGAGDAFLAGILVGSLNKMPLKEMGRFAAVVAACCVQAIGASSGIRSFEETIKLMNGKREGSGQ